MPRSAGSNLVLSTLGVEVLSTRDVLFSTDPWMHQRGTAIAVLSKDGARFAVAGIHLDLVEGPRLRHVGELDRKLAETVPDGVPVVVAGDANDRPDSLTWQALAAERRDAVAVARADGTFDWTGDEPRNLIDGIFADPRLSVTSARVLGGPDVAIASDHRPVLAELEL